MNTEHKTETTDDELIAIWDGWEMSGDDYEHSKWFLPHSLSQMKYKTSFDWIMPVVEKINSGAIDDYTSIHIDDDKALIERIYKNRQQY